MPLGRRLSLVLSALFLRLTTFANSLVYWFSYAYTPADSHTYCVPKSATNVVISGLFLHFLQYRYTTLCKSLKHTKSVPASPHSLVQRYDIIAKKLLDYKSHTHHMGAISLFCECKTVQSLTPLKPFLRLLIQCLMHSVSNLPHPKERAFAHFLTGNLRRCALYLTNNSLIVLLANLRMRLLYFFVKKFIQVTNTLPHIVRILLL